MSTCSRTTNGAATYGEDGEVPGRHRSAHRQGNPRERDRAPMNTTQRRRLERAGYMPVQVGKTITGWVPAAYANRVIGQIEAWQEDVAKLLDEPPQPRGRPRKSSA